MKNFCHLCGSKYVEGKQQPWQCSDCGNLSYKNSSPTTEVALFNDKGEVLLGKRGIEPNKGKYDLPGGFVNFSETAESSIAREIKEELDLDEADYSRLIYCTSWNADYNFSKEIVNTINLVFTGKLHTDDIKSQDDVSEIVFVSMDDLDSVDFSYPDYPAVIRKAYELLFS